MGFSERTDNVQLTSWTKYFTGFSNTRLQSDTSRDFQIQGYNQILHGTFKYKVTIRYFTGLSNTRLQSDTSRDFQIQGYNQTSRDFQIQGYNQILHGTFKYKATIRYFTGLSNTRLQSEENNKSAMEDKLSLICL